MMIPGYDLRMKSWLSFPLLLPKILLKTLTIIFNPNLYFKLKFRELIS